MTSSAGTSGTQSEPPVPPKASGSSATKWIAVIVVLVVIIGVLGVVALTKAPSKTIVKKVPVSVTYGTSASAVAAQTADVGSPYSFQLTTNGTFNYALINWGDGDIQYVPYSGVDTLNISHTYTSPGVYAIYYEVDFNGTMYNNANSIYTVVVGYPSASAQASAQADAAYGSLQLNYSSNVTSKPVSTNPIFTWTPGSNAEFNITSTTPTNSSISVVGQTLTVYWNSVAMENISVQYSGGSQVTFPVLNLTNMAAGYYTVKMYTSTAVLNSSTGAAIGPVYTTVNFMDIPVFSNVALYSPKIVPTGQYVRVELETGGFKTLDTAIAYDTVSFEIIENVYLSLFGYNMTNSTSTNAFVPILAKNLPSPSNGEVNTKTYYYNLTGPSGRYMVTVLPYENYTVYINNNSRWQNDSPVTAYDVYYSLVRTLLFDAGAPGTPGWIQAQFLLPGNYYVSNTFYNITTNMTVNNATNSITFHFQTPVQPALFYETFGQASGAFIMDAQWLMQHGAAIPWSPAGFQAYKAFGNQGSYDTYVQYNAFADGPYEVSYSVPSQEIVLTANPYFYSPNPYFPAPHIKTIFIKYVAEPSTSYLDLKSGYAQTASIPTSSWNLVESLQAAHEVGVIPFPTLSIFWYNFNALVNMSMLKAILPASNLPAVLFDSLQVRQAFAYAYNYVEYLNKDIGNSVYNITFASAYAGMLPAGMLYSQSIAQLNSTTSGVPYFDLTKAANLWSSFVNSTMAAKMGITWNATKAEDLYKGAPLNIPIFIFSADPIDVAGETQWASYLSTFIRGASFPVEPTAFTTLLGYQVQGQNPMPIYELGWAPDYPFPTDYLGPMALPINTSTYPGPNDMTPYWFNGNTSNPLKGLPEMVSQANNLTRMIEDYTNATSNPSIGEQNFHMMNEMLINMTFYVYIYQEYGFWIYNTNTNGSAYQNWELGVNTGMGGDLLYNYLYYNT